MSCDAVYRERDELVSFLTKVFESWLLPSPDPEDGFNYVVYVNGPTGQMSWHVHDSEIEELFPHLEVKKIGVKKWAWDGHTTEQKYARLRGISSDDVFEHYAEYM